MSPRINVALFGLMILGLGDFAAAGAPVYKSPEEVFAAMKRAGEKDDWKTICGCLTEESRDVMAGGIAMISVMFKAFESLPGAKGESKDLVKALDETLTKHGLTEAWLAKLKDAPPIDLNNPEAMKKALRKLVEPIRDRSAFVADVISTFKKLDKEKKKDGLLFPRNAELRDVTIDKGTAKGVVVSKMGDQEKRDPIQFRRVGASWLIELPDGQFKFGPGPQKQK